MGSRQVSRLVVWQKLVALDKEVVAKVDGSHECGVVTDHVASFEDIVNSFHRPEHRPSCFVNLACFLNFDQPSDRVREVIAPVKGYVHEGEMMGVMGPRGCDADNLLLTLTAGKATVVDVSVHDLVKFSEFVNNPECEDVDEAAKVLMKKLLVSPWAEDVIGTLVQRPSSNVPQSSLVKLGNKVVSIATRSILVLDQVHILKPQALFVLLKVIKKIVHPARLAVIYILKSPEEQQGLLPLLDTAMCFTEKGVGYFGPANHLTSYCHLIGLPPPTDLHITDHIRRVMCDGDTPFTNLYSNSILGRHTQAVIQTYIKPRTQQGT